jgi:hypothetical protein
MHIRNGAKFLIRGQFLVLRICFYPKLSQCHRKRVNGNSSFYIMINTGRKTREVPFYVPRHGVHGLKRLARRSTPPSKHPRKVLTQAPPTPSRTHGPAPVHVR